MYLPELRIERKKLIAEIRAIKDETRSRKFRVVEGDYDKNGEMVHFRRTVPLPNSSRCRNPLMRAWLLANHLVRAKKRLRINHIVAGFLDNRRYEEIEQGARNWPNFEEIRATLNIQLARHGINGTQQKRWIAFYDVEWRRDAQETLQRNQLEYEKKRMTGGAYLSRKSLRSLTHTSDAAGSATPAE
jgi:hypothetical protein